MKTYLKLLLFLTIASSSYAANVVLPVTESFAPGQTTYTVGASLNGQSNNNAAWFNAGNGSGTPVIPMTITNLNLSYIGLSQSISNAVRFGGQTNVTGADGTYGAKWNLYGLNATTGSLYYSLLLRVDDVGTLSTSGGYSVCFNNAAITTPSTTVPTVLASLLYLKATNGNQYNIGTAKRASTQIYDGVARNQGETVLIVSKYTFGAASQLWINPDPATFGDNATEPAATLTSVDVLTEIAAIQTLVLFQRTNSTMNLQPRSMVADEIRVGTTWAAVTPPFVSQPASRTNDAGTIATFSTTPIVDTTGLTYRWKKGGVNITDGAQPSGAVASGATTATLTLTGVLKADEGTYTVAATNSVNQGISFGATLTVNDPAISTQPTASQTVLPGVTVNLSVVAAGTPTVTYRWQKGGINLNNGGVVSGATTANLTLTGVSSGDAGTYTCAVTNSLGASVVSSNAVLTVVDPTITTHPASRTNNYGTSATFTVAAAGTPSFTYQWLKDGAAVSGPNISGATSATLTVNPVSYLDAAGYSVIVSNGIGNSVTSSIALLTVNDPYIITQPASRTNVAGTTATFVVAADGSPALTYQWKQGATVLVNGPDITGADAATLSLANVAAATAGNYTVIVSNPAGSNVTSAAAVLTVALPPTITQPPASRSVVAGVKVAFGVAATGFAPLGYQWKSNGVEIVGATASSYTIASAQVSDAATYSVVITNMAGTNSAGAILAVTSGKLHLYNTNLVVLLQGDGAAPLSLNGNSVLLSQYTTSGAYLNTVTIPDAGLSSMLQNVTSSDATFDSLTRSPDGWFLAFAGYATNLSFGATLNTTTSAQVPRAGGSVDGLGGFVRNVTTTTKFSASSVRGAVTDGTNNFWGVAGIEGIQYLGNASPAASVRTAEASVRVVSIFNGNLYFSYANSPAGIYEFTGLPTSTDSPVAIIQRLPADTSIGSPPAGGNNGIQDFAVCPTCPSVGGAIYIADDRAIAATTGGIEKWTYNGSAYAFDYRLNTGLTKGLRSIEVDWSGANPVIYAITVAASSTNTLVKVTDTGASSAFTTLATSGPNQLFRGVKFGPTAPSLLMSVANGSPSPTEATLSFHGVPNSDYVLQRSCLNLSNWVDIATNTAAPGSGLIQNVITPDNICNPAFYRTREK